jgi:heat shock protein HslJ
MYKILPGLLLFLISCGTAKQTGAGKQTDPPNPVTNSTLDQKQSEGIDFFAKGKQTSSWTLEIDFDKLIRFKSLDGNNIMASSTKPVDAAGGKQTTISTSTSFGEMKIDIYQEECIDEISGEKFSKKVTVKVNGKEYTGCGTFLSDKNITGKWTLQFWNGKKMEAADFAKGLPQLQFDMEANKISGHDGCNQLFAEMELRGNFIRIGAVGTTKMACPNKTDIGFAARLSNQLISYYFKDGNLHFYLPDDSVAIFTKS